MTNRTVLPVLLAFAVLSPPGVFAQKPEENWLGALSIQTGVVSPGAVQSAAMFGAGAELRRPHIRGGFLRVEVGGWRADVFENNTRVARWDQTLDFSLMHAFGHRTGLGALTPSVGLGVGLHSIGSEDARELGAPARFRRTLHPGAFMDAAIGIHLTRSDLLSVEAGGRYAAIANAPGQMSLRFGLRVHPGNSASGVIRSEALAPASGTLPKTVIAEAEPRARGNNGSHAAARRADAVELDVPAGAFAIPTQMTKDKSNEVKAAVRAFMRSDENAGADIVAFTSADDRQDNSATLRAATVARVLAAAGLRTDRLRIVVRVAAANARETDNVRVRLTH